MTVAEVDASVPIAGKASRESTSGSAVTLLSIYIALLWGIPTAQTIGALGSMGSPSMLWGFVCLGYWVWQRFIDLPSPTRQRLQPIRIAFLVFAVIALLSFSLAHARGLPGDEVSPSVTGLLRIASWAVVLLLAHDSVNSKQQLLLLIRRATLFGGLMALLGLVQFVTGQAWIDRVHIPGLAVNPDLLGVAGRSGFIRANATATHPLEFAAVLVAMLPLSIGMALTTVRTGIVRSWWIPAATGLACLVSSSRSAIIGFAVGIVAMLPVLSWRGRGLMLGAITVGLALVYVFVPGMLSTISVLFLSEDSSTESRSNGLSVVSEVAAHHPFLGRGFGTFLPKYYILDNELGLLLIEVGVLGLVAFLALAAAGVVQSQRAKRATSDPEIAVLAQALTAATAACVCLFALFDALSFGMAAGTLALLLGMNGAIHRVATSSSPSSGTGQSRQPQVLERGAPTEQNNVLRVPKSVRAAPAVALAVLLGTFATVGWCAFVQETPPVYYTRAEVFLVHEGVDNQKALTAPPDGALVPLAGVVEQVITGGRDLIRYNSAEATLYGLGVREGVSIQLINKGGQWAPLYQEPALIVETVGADPDSALATNFAAQRQISGVVAQLQDSLGVAKRAHSVGVLANPTLEMVEASSTSRLMSLAAAGAAGMLLTFGACVLLHGRYLGRTGASSN